MLTHASVKIVLDKELFYGGECLEGNAKLKVRKSEEITFMKVQIVAYKAVNIQVTEPGNNYGYGYGYMGGYGYNRKVDYSQSDNLFNNEETIFSEPKIFEGGTHYLPFKVLLPNNLPPSVYDSVSDWTYGENVFQVRVTLGRKKHGALSRHELTDHLRFSYSPLQFVDDFHLPEQKLMEYKFSDYFHKKGLVGEVKNTFSNSTSDPSSVIQINFLFPAMGLRQDIGNKFNVIVHRPPDSRPILVSHVKLFVEACALLDVENHTASGITQTAVLVDRRMNQEGEVVDLGPMMTDVRPSMHLVPSFMSPWHNHVTKLFLHLTVKQDSPEGPKIAHVKTSVDLNVLSAKVTQTPSASQVPPPPAYP